MPGQLTLTRRGVAWAAAAVLAFAIPFTVNARRSADAAPAPAAVVEPAALADAPALPALRRVAALPAPPRPERPRRPRKPRTVAKPAPAATTAPAPVPVATAAPAPPPAPAAAPPSAPKSFDSTG
jgi:hypothetical protein